MMGRLARPPVRAPGGTHERGSRRHRLQVRPSRALRAQPRKPQIARPAVAVAFAILGHNSANATMTFCLPGTPRQVFGLITKWRLFESHSNSPKFFASPVPRGCSVAFFSTKTCLLLHRVIEQVVQFASCRGTRRTQHPDDLERLRHDRAEARTTSSGTCGRRPLSSVMQPASCSGSAPRRLASLTFVSVTFTPQIADIHIAFCAGSRSGTTR